MKKPLLALFSLFAVYLAPLSAPAQDVRFIVAVKGVPQVRSSSREGWNVDIGEVYQFVRYVSRTEYSGLAPEANDQTYTMAKMGSVVVIAPTEGFVLVPQQDLVKAAIKYGEQVAEETRLTSAPTAPTPRPQPTQYNGRPLPANWIDPQQADANFNAQQLQRQIEELRQKANERH